MEAYNVRFDLGGISGFAVVLVPGETNPGVRPPRPVLRPLRSHIISAFREHFFPIRPNDLTIIDVTELGPVAVHPVDRLALAEALLNDPHVHPVESPG